jgi:hypothetical protein
LEETAVIFDGERAEADLQARGGQAATITMHSRGDIGLFSQNSIEVARERIVPHRDPEQTPRDRKELVELRRLSDTDSEANSIKQSGS